MTTVILADQEQLSDYIVCHLLGPCLFFQVVIDRTASSA